LNIVNSNENLRNTLESVRYFLIDAYFDLFIDYRLLFIELFSLMNPQINTNPKLVCAGVFIAVIACSLAQKWRRNPNKKDEEGDNYHQVRYQTALRDQQFLAHHYGSCHCQKVHFRVLAPRTIYAVDIPSKLRYPRVTVNYTDFELLIPDLTVLSVYAVTQSGEEQNNNSLGIHSFCSFCGMQIMYAPSMDPKEIQVNLDCLNQETIQETHIAYHSQSETSAAFPLLNNSENNSEEAPDKRGLGHWTSPNKLFHEIAKDLGQSQQSSSFSSNESSGKTDLESLASLAHHHNNNNSSNTTSNNKKPQKEFFNDPRDTPDNSLMEDSLSVDDDCSNLSSSSSFPWQQQQQFYGGERGTLSGRSRVSFSSSLSNSPNNRNQSQIDEGVDYSSYQQMRRFLHKHLKDEQNSLSTTANSKHTTTNSLISNSPSRSTKNKSFRRHSAEESLPVKEVFFEK
jgi:hypothetical protein